MTVDASCSAIAASRTTDCAPGPIGVDGLDLDDEQRVAAVEGGDGRAAAEPQLDVVAALHPVTGPGGVDGLVVRDADDVRQRPADGVGRRARHHVATLVDATATTRSGSVTASSTPCGWIAPGTWIGSAAQLSRSTGADHVAVTAPPRPSRTS